MPSTYIWKDHGCNKPYSAVGRPTTAAAVDWASAWHEYAVEYYAGDGDGDGDTGGGGGGGEGGGSGGYVAFAVDGIVFSNVTNATTFDVPYYMILDTSVGSARAGPPDAKTVFPTYHRIDYVRVAQPST